MDRPRGCRRGETSIEAVLIVPIVLTLLFAGVHVTSLARAAQVANIAATRGAQVAAASPDGASPLPVLREVDVVVGDLGGRAPRPARVSVGPRTVRVTVELEIRPVVPFLPVRVVRAATAPRERFLLEQER
jgi:hypothetical protein